MRVIDQKSAGFDQELDGLLQGMQAIPREVTGKVEKIFDDIKAEGDEALFRWTEQLDGVRLTPATAKVSGKEMEEAIRNIDRGDLKAIKAAAVRIQAYHKTQVEKGSNYCDHSGTAIAERVVPLSRVGIYIPAGRAPLASTVLMCGIPAKLAGVKEVVMITPAKTGKVDPHILAAAVGANITEIYKIGGAQGVAALAQGTKSIRRVDKIVGPGSIWVAAAKAVAMGRGLCGIDAIAGPSEVVVAADESANPAFVAVDLLSQAEHGPGSTAFLVTTSGKLIKAAEPELEKGLDAIGLSGAEREACRGRVAAILVRDRESMAKVVNLIAPEHLEIITAKPKQFSNLIVNAASIFLGPYSPVPAGDYIAGGNHVLPTGGTARWSSPLSVRDFVKRQSVTCLSRFALASVEEAAGRFASFEGLPGHGLAVAKRFKN